MIQFRGVTTQSGALSGLDLAFEQGMTQVVLSVETEALSQLEGLLTGRLLPAAGEITLDGESYSGVATQHVGRSERLIDAFTVAQNVYGLNDAGLFFFARKHTKECRSLIQQFSLPLDAGALTASLSAEQRKLVELLRCFVNRPRVIVLHEILSALSYKNILLMKNMLLALKNNGTHVVYLTSKLEDIFKLGERVHILCPGYPAETYPVEDIRANPQLLYNAVLGARQDALDDEDLAFRKVLGIIRDGTRYIISREGLVASIRKYAQYLESAIPGSQVAVYLERNGQPPEMIAGAPGAPRLLPATLDFLFGQAGIFYAAAGDPAFPRLLNDASRCKAVACVPVELLERTAGLLQLTFEVPRTLSRTDEKYCRMVASEIALLLEISNSLDKSILLQESNHRIKNNLQLIVSMLMLQRANLAAGDPGDRDGSFDVINTTISRIQCMANVHDLLSRENIVSNFLKIDALFEQLKTFYHREIQIQLHIEGTVNVAYNHCSAVALILNELISNSIKHNPAPVQPLAGRVTISQEADVLRIHYCDNGRGFREDFDPELHGGLGMMILKSVAGAAADTQFRCYCHNGACTELTLRI